MFDKIRDFIGKGGIFKHILPTIVWGGGAGFGISIFICILIAEYVGSDILANLAGLLLVPVCTVGAAWMLLDGPSSFRNDISEDEELERVISGEIAKDRKVPHFGELFGGDDKTKELLKKEVFHPYILKNGKSALFLKVSESGRWFSIWHRYFPSDFICGYNKQRCELYTVDGVLIRLPVMAESGKCQEELEEYFKERGDYYEYLSRDELLELKRRNGNKNWNSSKDDWSMVRYKWEKEMLNGNESAFPQLYGTVSVAPDNIFHRVLSDDEIQQIKNAIRKNMVDIKRYLCFGDYKNEYSVCNTIELLKQLGHPANLEGCDFLFDCLGNIDEPYFLKAVSLLKSYPKSVREEKIEEYAEAAHKSGDVEKFGGILYLAKELKYDIKYVEKMKAEEAKEASPGQVMQMSK